MNDNIFKYNDRKRVEHDEKFNVFCEVYDPNLKHTKKEWLDILKQKGVVITRMTLHRYTKKYFENVTHEESVTHGECVKPQKRRSVPHNFESVSHEIESVSHEGSGETHVESGVSYERESVSLEEILESTKKNPIIREILLQERTSGTKFGINPDEVVPRYMKSAATRKERTKTKAEVFTPIEIVKQMNDSFDKDYKGSDLDYIKRTSLEVTCGEAPFLTTRYDPYTGRTIPIDERVGLLDRKLQHIHTDNETEWCIQAEFALKSTFGFEWQEDSLYIARMNVLLSVVESFIDKFGRTPKGFERWAEIVSYNLFRMDGVSLCLPETETPALVMNWEDGKMERFDGEEDSLPTTKRNTRRKGDKRS